MPKSEADRAELAVTIGRDGFALLEALISAGAPAWLRQIPAVEVLRAVWVQQYHRTVTGTSGTEVAWREGKDLPPGRARLASAYDVDARYGLKRGSGWVGYKIHLTETCDRPESGGAPHVITNVETTDATIADSEVTGLVHDHLARRDLLPGEHVLDAGYTSAELVLASSIEYDVELIGPLGADTTWQAGHPDAFDLSHFSIDWDARRNQATEAWKQRYNVRAGIEGTVHQAVATTGIRRSRYRGLPKTHLTHVLAATAINLIRLDAWWTDTPLGSTHTSHLAALNFELAAMIGSVTQTVFPACSISRFRRPASGHRR